LARTYDHVVVDAGAAAEGPLGRLAQIMHVAVLVCDRIDDVAAVGTREQMYAAGFKFVRMLPGPQADPKPKIASSREAA
jgi:hypothetical protein